MPLAKDTPAPYAPTKAILSLLERSRTRGLPTTFDKDALMRMGISESLAPRTLQSLQTLDLIDEDGRQTEMLERLRLTPETEYQNQLAEWLNTAYADILQYVNPEDGDEASVRDAFRPYKPHSVQDRMQNLFTGLYAAAGIWPDGARRTSTDRTKTIVVDAKRRRSVPPVQENSPLPPASSIYSANPQNVSEKALEYRLVDLMSEAAGDEEVMSAIITVITFLKTKNGAEK